MPERLLRPLAEATQMLGIGRSTLYELISDGEIKTVKIGNRTLIAQAELERYVQSLANVKGPPPGL